MPGPWEKYAAPVETGPWAKYATPSIDPQQAMQQHAGSLDYKMAVARGKEAETLPQYAGGVLKTGVLPTIGAAVGTIGGLPGQMAGAALGETANQALEIGHRRSVIPEADKPDLGKVALVGASPLIAKGITAGAEKVGQFGRWVGTQLAPEKFANKWLKESIGDKAIPKVAQALADQSESIPGYPATAAEKVAHLPEGTVIQSHQKIVAKTPGGISSDFATRKLDQGVAVEGAKTARDLATKPLRDQAFQLAEQGGVQSRDVLDGIAAIEKDPGFRASDIVSKSLAKIREKIGSLTDANGTINPESLYTVRKEIGNTVHSFSKETGNWDKKLTARIERDIQKGIDWAMDNAINRAQGLGQQFTAQAGQQAVGAPVSPWQQYLKSYSERSGAISDTLARQKLAGKPIQPTSLPGGVNMMPSGTEHLLPNWLSKPVTGTKWLAGRYASYMEPRIDRYMADLYLHPEKMAGMLRGQAPSRYQQIAETLAQQGPYALTISNAREK